MCQATGELCTASVNMWETPNPVCLQVVVELHSVCCWSRQLVLLYPRSLIKKQFDPEAGLLCALP